MIWPVSLEQMNPLILENVLTLHKKQCAGKITVGAPFCCSYHCAYANLNQHACPFCINILFKHTESATEETETTASERRRKQTPFHLVFFSLPAS